MYFCTFLIGFFICYYNLSLDCLGIAHAFPQLLTTSFSQNFPNTIENLTKFWLIFLTIKIYPNSQAFENMSWGKENIMSGFCRSERKASDKITECWKWTTGPEKPQGLLVIQGLGRGWGSGKNPHWFLFLHVFMF